MGCDVAVAGDDPATVAAVLERWEETFSLFRPESELSRVNRSPARVLAVSPLFARALEVALDVAAETDGLVDPTLCGRWPEVVLSGRMLSRPPGLGARPERRRQGARRRRGRGDSRAARASSRSAATSPCAGRSTSRSLPAARSAWSRAASRRAARPRAARTSSIPRTGSAERVARGSRSRPPARRASPPTSPRRPASSSASAGRSGSTSAGSRAASSALDGEIVENDAWRRHRAVHACT